MSNARPRDTRTQIKLAGSALALLLLAVFIGVNFEEVKIDLLLGTQTTRLAFALIFAGLLGFLAGYFVPKGRANN
jgi:uncharacterized integral membrane protein